MSKQSEIVCFKLHPQLKDALRLKSDNLGISMSEYIKLLLNVALTD